MAIFLSNLPFTEEGAKLNLTAEQEENCRLVYKKDDEGGAYFVGSYDPDADYLDDYYIVPFKSAYGGSKNFDKETEFANVKDSITTKDPKPSGLNSWIEIYRTCIDPDVKACCMENKVFNPDNGNEISGFKCDEQDLHGGHIVRGRKFTTLDADSEWLLLPICINHSIHKYGNRKKGTGYYMRLAKDTTAAVMAGYMKKSDLQKALNTPPISQQSNILVEKNDTVKQPAEIALPKEDDQISNESGNNIPPQTGSDNNNIPPDNSGTSLQSDDGGVPSSFADILYNEITNVIGGDSGNQFFCMGLPGTLILKSQYEYDIHNNEAKPSYVEANESKLVNKLFDAARMVPADNGRHLQTQYKTALDMLTPKLNGKLFDAKNKLRDVLMMPYQYDFGGGNKTMTLGQVFYTLYDDYVEAKQKWTQEQDDKKKDIEAKNPGSSAEINRKRTNMFLDWYAIAAPAKVLYLEEKLSKVLGVFSPGDMEIIIGILDSGTGREVAEARSTLANVQKMNPDGGYIYPVTLYPENWFELLDTSFTPVDLLESPQALMQQLVAITNRRNAINSRINIIMAAIPDDDDIKNAKNNYNTAAKAYDEKVAKIAKTMTNVATGTIKTLIDAAAAIDPTAWVNPSASVVTRITGLSPDTVKDVLTKLSSSASEALKAQQALVNAAQESSNAAMNYIKITTKSQFKEMLIPLRDQLAETQSELDSVQQRLDLALAMQPKKVKEAGGKAGGKTEGNDEEVTEYEESTDDNDVSAVAPTYIPNNYTQVIITSDMSKVENVSSQSASNSASTSGVSFLFGGCSTKKSHSQAYSKVSSAAATVGIQIGMSIAKVSIGREWFNPGVFMLSADMYNVSSKKISPSKKYNDFSDPARFSAMRECAFPCFPAAFVVARDVTIKFTHSTNISEEFAQSVEDHSSKGGGFFIFSSSSSNSSSSSQTSSKATSTSNSVTVRFTNPQILGYYLEATPPDESTYISDETSKSSSDFISVFQFIEDFKKMLEEHNKKNDVSFSK